ncbi:MAG: DUF4870 domain-containing protein [Anaerolineales bacterium]|nr:DUF4870 domain-containing protein [Anaerolineales bacterium]
MKCYYHPEMDAVGTCVVCHKAVCSGCGIEVQGKLVCRECLKAEKTDGLALEITDNDKMMALLSYVISIIVPLIILLSESSKQRKFQRYHAVHALATASVLWVVITLASCFVTIITLGYGSCLALPLMLLPYIPMIYYGVQAYQGRYVDIPLVTDFVKNQGWV